jgi:very-short-patch-repair endonuclease
MAFRTHNNPKFKGIRKELRNNATSAEAVLWTILKKKQVGGLKFRRQHSPGNKKSKFPSLPGGVEPALAGDGVVDSNRLTI